MNTKRIVLIGAGHAHVQVLRRWIDVPPVQAEVVVVVDNPESTYSGMVPGVIAGDYRLQQARIAVLPLAHAARARVIVQPARRIDPVRRSVELHDGTALSYDVASLDVGSGVRGLELPGVRDYALATRPIDAFATEFDRRISRLDGRRMRVAVVGAGAAGVEIAFTLKARPGARTPAGDVVVVCGSDGLLPAYSGRVQRLVAREALRAGITITATSEVRSVTAGGIVFAGGSLEADLVVWATGAAAPALVADSPLLHDDEGFVRVRPTLEVVGAKGLFAAGDCASIEGFPWLPKAGVHAVRQAPVLESNLLAASSDRAGALRSYQPQRDFLSLINLGRRRALATKWGFAVAGHVPWLLKDRIDRGFVRRFAM